MTESNTRYRTSIVLMIVGLQLSVLGLADDQFLFLLLLYLGPMLTFAAAVYALSDLQGDS